MIEVARALGVEVHAESRLVRWFLPKGTIAVTIGRHVLFAGTPTPETLAHELAHVEQWARHGLEGFLVRHIWYALTRGYPDNPFEIEARQRARGLLASWLRAGLDAEDPCSFVTAPLFSSGCSSA